MRQKMSRFFAATILLASVSVSPWGFAAPAAAQAPAQTLCTKIVASYRALLALDPNSPSRGFYPDSPLSRLGAQSDSGISIAPHIAETGKQQTPLQWAQSQKPPIALSAELHEALDTSDFLDRLPGSDYYAASRIEGTMSCYASSYFTVKANRAAPAQGPVNWSEDDGDSCGMYRTFGSVGAQPVAYEENYDYGSALTSSLSVSAWDSGHFAPACKIGFRFAPRFAANEHYNEWDQSCTGKDCDALRQASLHLAETVQADPAAAAKSLPAKLNDTQRAAYLAMMKDAQATEPEKLQDPADLTDQSPLCVPLVGGDQLYLAQIGHFTIGWRSYSDWNVKLLQRQGKDVSPVASFAIGMTKGKLEQVDVK